MTLELGQRVLFRSLQWEVEDNSSESTVTLFGRDRANQGRRVTAVLGLEPIERADPADLLWTITRPGWDLLKWKALHHAFRLTLTQGRGSLASVDWGRLILEPYQLVPLQRIENLPFPRLMLADDTGLGKTAEAGLILFRLLQRRRADRVLILCRAQPEPERWRDEMKEKFGIDFTVVNSGSDYARIRREVPAHLNVFGYVPRLAMSMYFAAQDHIVDDLRRDVRWDVVIIDEAHHLAERGTSDKKLAELGRVVAERCEALLLLTATPHDGKAESFASLLRLLDPYVVVDPERLDPALVRPLVVRRLKPNVVRADGGRFLRRQIHPLEVEPSKAEVWLDRGLRGYCKQLRERAALLKKEGQRNRAMGASFLESFLRKRLASSTYACRESLVRRREVLLGKLPLTGDESDLDDRDDRPVYNETVELPSGKSEIEVVEDLIARAARIPEGGETKADALVRLLQKILAKPSEKVLVFTEFVDTLTMLAGVFERAGWREQEDFVRYEGATPRAQRETIRRRFLEDPRMRILLATDAASESINLHKGCNNLIHYEAVWNPNRYEQRNGRIDRYGQTAQPQIHLLLNKGSFDQRVALVGYAKLEKIAEDVGSVSNVLPLASRISVDDFIDRYEDEKDAAEEMERRLAAAATQAAQEEDQEGTADLVRGDSFEATELRSVEDALDRSRSFVPEFRDVEEFLRVYLRAESGRIEPVPGEPDVFTIYVPHILRRELGRERIDRATFRRDLAVREVDLEEAKRVEFLSPGHPLVRTALRRVRGWIYSPAFPSRVSFRRVDAKVPPGFLFTFAARFLDGRGEAIEESFEPVFVDLAGRASTDHDRDVQIFADPGPGGNATPAEEQALKTAFATAFEQARDAALAEVSRRATAHVQELAAAQRRIAEEALIRLGRWQQATEERQRRQLEAATARQPTGHQFDLAGKLEKDLARAQRERERKLAQFRREQERLLKDEQERRHDIRAMESVRLDSIEPIGALALVPEGGGQG